MRGRDEEGYASAEDTGLRQFADQVTDIAHLAHGVSLVISKEGDGAEQRLIAGGEEPDSFSLPLDRKSVV